MRKTKYCPRCGEIKESSCFYKNACQSSGLSSYCKSCTRARARELYKEGKIKPRKQSSEYYKKYYEDNKERIKLVKRAYQKDNKEKVKEWHKRYRERHRAEIKEASRAYRSAHKKELSDKALIRLQDDPLHKEREKCRASIRGVWRRDRHKENSPVEQLIGCTPYCLKKHLLLTWKNRYGTDWKGEKCEIDHIVPLCEGKTIAEIRALCNFQNLQLLTPEDNAAKHTS